MNIILRTLVLFISIGVFVVGIIFSNSLSLLYSVLIILVHNFWFSLEKFYSRVIFFVFNGTFFIFLVGRMVVNVFFNYKESPNMLFGLNFSEVEVVNHVLISLYISLLFLFLGYVAFQKNNRKRLNKKNNSMRLESYFKSVRVFSKYFFYFALIFRLVYLREAMDVSVTEGYYESFSTFQSQMPWVFVFFSNMYDVAFFAFLATKPRKKEIVLPASLYLLEGVFSLLSGRRSGFMLNILILFIYFCLRNVEGGKLLVSRSKQWLKKMTKWIGKKEIIITIILLPFIMIILNVIGHLRGGAEADKITFFGSLFEFFYAQGVSANVIGYTYFLSDSIPNKLFSIGPVIEFTNNILGVYDYVGHSAERALNGHLFSHTISYLIMGDLYLSGVGYGSSYIAELFNDFGYFGIVIGSVFYGILIAKFYNWIQLRNNLFLITVTLLMTRSFLFTPRAATLSFLVSTFSLTKILALIIIFIGSIVVKDLIPRGDLKEGAVIRY